MNKKETESVKRVLRIIEKYAINKLKRKFGNNVKVDMSIFDISEKKFEKIFGKKRGCSSVQTFNRSKKQTGHHFFHCN